MRGFFFEWISSGFFKICLYKLVILEGKFAVLSIF